jgi:hypothetical protein
MQAAEDAKDALPERAPVPGPVARSVGNFFRGIGNLINDNTPARNARRMLNPTDADERWKGMDYLASYPWGQRPPYTAYYKRLAAGRAEDNLKADADYTVRAKAVRALNRSRDASAVPTFVAALGDESDLVRLEAAKALTRVPDPSAVAPLVKVVSEPSETRDVRTAAAAALRHYRTLDVARALVNQLGSTEFEVAYQARRSLRQITEKDFRYDQAAWLGFITGPEKPFG